ncbi:MAG: T9SS type A sorting domain-containing protein [Bacteroidia bacterium]
MKKFLQTTFISILFIFAVFKSSAQVQQFTLSIDTASFISMPHIHSYAHAEWNDKWIFIGGRTNGLHGFTPPSGFTNNGINDSIYVVDPVTDTRMAVNIFNEFTDTLMLNALRASFFEYSQNDSMLYMVGGFGYTLDSSSYSTHANLIAVNIKNLVDDITNGLPVAPDFRLLQDSVFKVCGGNMYRMDSTYYLVFGHDFNNYYSVNDTLGFFSQQYTCEIRKFQINDDGINLSISNYNAIHDSANFHRRDYNLVPQIFPDGTTGLTAFSGVFQYFAPNPFLNSVNITSAGYEVINNFNQNLSQYNSAVMPVYNTAENKMSTVFFGGMSLYQLDTVTNTLVTDTLIPFVKTISKVVRYADSSMTEYANPTSMPALIGTNSIFIPSDSVTILHDGIIDLNALPYGITLAGRIIGGINSNLPNVSTSPNLSHAENLVYNVYLNKFIDTKIEDHEVKNDILNLLVYPNPTDQTINIQFETQKPGPVSVNIYTSHGSLVKQIYQGSLTEGKHEMKCTLQSAGTYFCKVQTENHIKSIMVVVK